MKIILLVAGVCMLNFIYAGSTVNISGIRNAVILLDTLPPKPSSMQPVPQSTVNGNGTPVLPSDTSRHPLIDTAHVIH